MFEKLLSLVPYNPGLGHQLAFYSRRMREEASIRRVGLVFLSLTFVVQFLAVINPPQPTLADSNNDLIVNGFTDRAEAEQQCLNNVRHYADIMHYYGLSCHSIRSGEVVTLHSNTRDWFSMGWHPQGERNQVTHELTHETPVNIPGAGTLYWRKLSSFDTFTGNGDPYKAVVVRNSEGREFFILYRCGNLVTVGIPSPPQKPLPEEVGTAPAPTPTPTPAPAPAPVPTPAPKQTPPELCPLDNSLLKTDIACQPCPYNSLIIIGSSECKPCDKSISSQDTAACISVHKTASNVTAGISDANNTTANPGDVINYTLYAENQGKAKFKQFVFQENLSDVLDYADVADLHGGKIDNEQVVTWPTVNIPAGKTVTEQITVKVKNPVPQTPMSASDPAHFDLVMTNVYGNTINIKVPGAPAKTVEVAAAKLPNTGPGTSLFIAGTVVMLAGYFYSRARLLARESELAVKDVAAA